MFLHTLGTTDTVLVAAGPGGAPGNALGRSVDLGRREPRSRSQSFASDMIPGPAARPARSSSATSPPARPRWCPAPTALDGGRRERDLALHASISADGHCVAFDSYADNLVGGPPGTDFSRGYMRALDGDCGTPPPPAGPPSAPGPAPDTTAPTISGLKASPAKFGVSSKSTAVSAKKKKVPKGTKIKFKLSEAAKVSLKIELKSTGHKKGKKCVAKRRTGKRCTIYKAKGTLKRNGKAGANTRRVQRADRQEEAAEGQLPDHRDGDRRRRQQGQEEDGDVPDRLAGRRRPADSGTSQIAPSSVQQRTTSRTESTPAMSPPSVTTRWRKPPRTIATAASSSDHSGAAKTRLAVRWSPTRSVSGS